MFQLSLDPGGQSTWSSGRPEKPRPEVPRLQVFFRDAVVGRSFPGGPSAVQIRDPLQEPVSAPDPPSDYVSVRPVGRCRRLKTRQRCFEDGFAFCEAFSFAFLYCQAAHGLLLPGPDHRRGNRPRPGSAREVDSPRGPSGGHDNQGLCHLGDCMYH